MRSFLIGSTILLSATAALAQTAQPPAYRECTELASSNPPLALAKADAWLKLDTGVSAQHCRAMALYGLGRFGEAGDALAGVRDAVRPENLALRGYIARQAAKAYANANQTDKAIAQLSAQINEIGGTRGDNVGAAKLASQLLLDRARLNITFGKMDVAAQDLDHAVSLTPINEEVLLERASVFETMGDTALARSDAEAVLKLSPANAKARGILSRLGGIGAGMTEITPPAANPINRPVSAPYASDEAPFEQPADTIAEPKKKPIKKRVRPKKPTTAPSVAPASASNAAPAPVSVPVSNAAAPAASVATPAVIAPAPTTSLPAAPQVTPPVISAPIAVPPLPTPPKASSGLPPTLPLPPVPSSK